MGEGTAEVLLRVCERIERKVDGVGSRVEELGVRLSVQEERSRVAESRLVAAEGCMKEMKLWKARTIGFFAGLAALLSLATSVAAEWVRPSAPSVRAAAKVAAEAARHADSKEHP